MRVNYSEAIQESEEELKQLEKQHRGRQAYPRIQMLRLLKSGKVKNQPACAEELGYSQSSIERWCKIYRDLALSGLLQVSKDGGRPSRLTPEAWEGLQQELELGKIRRLQDAVDYLKNTHGVVYQSTEGVRYLFTKFRVKLKTGRPRHRRKDEAAGLLFKKPA